MPREHTRSSDSENDQLNDNDRMTTSHKKGKGRRGEKIVHNSIQDGSIKQYE